MNDHKLVISVIGLGYVGLPVAVSLAKKFKAIGFDINLKRIEELKRGYDKTKEITEQELKNSHISFTNSLEVLKEANFHIVAVPTPINNAKQPDLTPIISASKIVGKTLKKGDIVVYESTVYPGTTEEVCMPILETESGLKAGIDFKVGYSPERINPGDKEHTFEKITKVVSGQDEESLETIAHVYSSVVEAGIHRASSIKVAEAAKIIENIQRDVNIALMNELAVIFEKMNISAFEVIEAASTKWNFLKFHPGLVGGHCIGVDPYYLTHKAEMLGHHPEVILSGRRINDNMGKFIAEKAIKLLALEGIDISKAVITVLGLTFKENCPDLRNSKVIDIINELKSYSVTVQVCDPVADKEQALEEYGIELIELSKLKPCDSLIGAVKHNHFLSMDDDLCKRILKPHCIGIDVKNYLVKNQFKRIWTL